MKRPVFILRLGQTYILPADTDAMVKILDDSEYEDHELLGADVRIGVLSILLTDVSIQDIVNTYKETNDYMPVVVWEADSKTTAFDLDNEAVQKLIDEFCKLNKIEDFYGTECNLELDELLDKVSRVGEIGLTTKEFTRLKFLSNNI